MAPVHSILAVALIALGSVNAKSKNKLSYSLYSGDDCNGHPVDADIHDFDEFTCSPLQARSVRIHRHSKDKYSQWVNRALNGMDDCSANVYRGIGCEEKNILEALDLPQDLNNCTKLDTPMAAIQFSCKPRQAPSGIAFEQDFALPMNIITTKRVSINASTLYTPLPVVTETVYSTSDAGTTTITLFAPKSDAITPSTTMTLTPTTTVTLNHLDARAEHIGAAEASLDSRAEGNIKGVWMKHPWGAGHICYKCWTTKDELDFGNFKCRSGIKYPIDCGPKPSSASTTTTAVATSTVSSMSTVSTLSELPVITVTLSSSSSSSVSPTTVVVSPVTSLSTVSTPSDLPVITVTLPTGTSVSPSLIPSPSTPTVTITYAKFAADARSSPTVQKRSWHTPVVFRNPWQSGASHCADAEWENRGKDKQEIRLQKVKDLSRCSGKHPVNLDIGGPAVTSPATITVTLLPRTTSTLTPESVTIWTPITTSVVIPQTVTQSTTSTDTRTQSLIQIQPTTVTETRTQTVVQIQPTNATETRTQTVVQVQPTTITETVVQVQPTPVTETRTQTVVQDQPTTVTAYSTITPVTVVVSRSTSTLTMVSSSVTTVTTVSTSVSTSTVLSASTTTYTLTPTPSV